MTVGIVGLGSIARKHIAALRHLDPGVSFVALRHAAGGADEAGVTSVYDMEALLAAAPAFIIVSNPTADHYATVCALSESGIPLFIEKPLFDTPAHPLPAVKGMTYVACNLRFLDSLRWVKAHLGEHRLNEVNAYCGSYLPEWRPGVADWRKVYSANRAMGGGVHIDLIHEMDYLYWLFGAPQQVRKTFRNVSSLAIDAWDYANYCLEYPTFAASVILNYYRRDYRRRLELVFDEVTWEVDLAENVVREVPSSRELFRSAQRFAGTYEAQMRDFLNRMRHPEQEPFNTIEEAYAVLRICME